MAGTARRSHGCFCLLLLGAVPRDGWAGDRDAVTLCDTHHDRALPQQVDAEIRRWLPEVRVSWTLEPPCRRRRPRPGAYVAWFSGRDGRVSLSLRASNGTKHSRVVPWLARPRTALASLCEQQRLSQLSVLLKGLLVEHRLGLLVAGTAGRLVRPGGAPTRRAARTTPMAGLPAAKE